MILQPNKKCRICGTEIMHRINMGETEPYWIHLTEWWQTKDHKPEPGERVIIVNPAPEASEYAWW